MRLQKILELHSTLMYLVTFAAEVPVILTRFMLVYCTMMIVLAVTGHDPNNAQSWAQLAYIPSAWSLLALVTPAGSGWWWKQHMGGREPSEREHYAYQQAMQLLADSTSEQLPQPKSWFVLDVPQLEAGVCANALMLSRGLLESDHLPAILAHELGHLASPDGKLTAAINRLIIFAPRPNRDPQAEQQPPRQTVVPFAMGFGIVVFLIRFIFALIGMAFRFARGGFALRILQPIWGGYWREREYIADQYAAKLGQAEDLIEALELHILIHDQPVPFIWLSDHTHPPTELRIDRLRKADVHTTRGAQSATHANRELQGA